MKEWSHNIQSTKANKTYMFIAIHIGELCYKDMLNVVYHETCLLDMHLLPIGSEEHEVLLFGSIYEGILQAHHQIVQIEKKPTKILG